MKRRPQDQSRKTRHRSRSPAYALRFVFFGWVLGLATLGLTPPSQSSSTDRTAILVPGTTSLEIQAKSPDGVWSGMDQASVASAQQQRTDISSYRTVSLNQRALAAILEAAPL